MLKKTITYQDYNGNTRTEDFFFNLSKAEIVEMELRENLQGGLKPILEAVIASNDGRQIMDTFKMIISKAYGIKSPDGRSFLKSEEISSGFLGSEAYSQIFLELVMNPNSAAAFINAIVPADLGSAANPQPQGRPQPQDHLPAQPVTRNVPTTPGFEQVPGPVQHTQPAYDEVHNYPGPPPEQFQSNIQFQGEPQQPEQTMPRPPAPEQYYPRPPHESGLGNQ